MSNVSNIYSQIQSMIRKNYNAKNIEYQLNKLRMEDEEGEFYTYIDRLTALAYNLDNNSGSRRDIIEVLENA